MLRNTVFYNPECVSENFGLIRMMTAENTFLFEEPFQTKQRHRDGYFSTSL